MFEDHLFMLGTLKGLHPHNIWAWRSLLYICFHDKGPLSTTTGPGTNFPGSFFPVQFLLSLPPRWGLLSCYYIVETAVVMEGSCCFFY